MFLLNLTGLGYSSVEECLEFDLQHCRKLKGKEKRREEDGYREEAERKLGGHRNVHLLLGGTILASLLDQHNETLLTSKQLKEVFRNILNPESSL